LSTFSSANVTDGNLLLKESTHTINNKILLHILGVPPNKLGNWLMVPIAWYLKVSKQLNTAKHHSLTDYSQSNQLHLVRETTLTASNVQKVTAQNRK